MEQHRSLVDSLKDSRNPWEDVFSRHSGGSDNHLCTVRFDTDKKRKRREILGHRKGVVGIYVNVML